MNLAIETIKKNSKLLYEAMQRMYRYTFNELQKLCKLKDTELCLAIVRLLQEGKITQDRNEFGVYYALVN